MHARTPFSLLAARALVSHGQLAIYHYPEVLLHKAALQQVSLQPVLVLGVIPPQGQDPTLTCDPLAEYS